MADFVSYDIVKFEVIRNREPHMQLQDFETGKIYEASLGFARNKETNELIMHPIRHYTDPESQAWFPDSDVWPSELLEKDE